MPLTAKGAEIKSALTKEYGAEKGERVLYAGQNKGTFTGIDAESKAPEGRKTLEIKKTPMLPEDEAYLKRMIEEKKVKPEDRKPYTGPKYSPDSATMTHITDAVNNLQQRFDAMYMRKDGKSEDRTKAAEWKSAIKIRINNGESFRSAKTIEEARAKAKELTSQGMKAEVVE